MKFRILAFSLLFVVGAFMMSALKPNKIVDGNEKERLILYAVMSYIENMHFKDVPIDDEFSKKAFEIYLKRLDGSKRFLTIEDLNKINDYKDKIDNAIEDGNLEFFDQSYDLIENAIKRVEDFYPALLEVPYDLSGKDLFETDGEKRAFAKDDTELKAYWKQYIKFEVLTRVVDKLEDQMDDDEPEGGKKTIAELEVEARDDVKELFSDWFERLGKVRRSDRFEMFINSITNVFDPHTDYFNPKKKKDFDITMSNRLEGIGARLSPDKDFTKVVSIVPGGPAYKQGDLEVDDLITKVTQDDGEEGIDVVGMHLDDVVQKIRGPKGTKVFLMVKKSDGSSVEIAIVRDKVVLDEGLVKSATINFPGRIDNVGYIKLPRFYADFDNPEGNGCFEDMAIELEKLKEQNVNGIIIDLRNNTGGSLNDVVQMSGLFVEKGPVVQVKKRTGSPYIYRDKDPKVQYDGPLIVMVNKYSASASEILAAALQDYGRAVIVGSTSTFGKGTVQRFFDLDRGITGYEEMKPLGSLKMTIQKFYRVDGGSTQLKGVTPDIILPDNTQYIKVGEQEQDAPMEWTEIAKADYKRNSSFDEIRKSLAAKSSERLSTSDVFTKINDNALRLKDAREMSEFPLNLDEYRLIVQERTEESKKFKKLFRKIDGLTPENLAVDLPKIQQDSSKIGRNDSFMKNIRKDVYIDETLNIMRDLIAISEKNRS